MDRSNIRRSYWKTTALATLTCAVTVAATVALAQGGGLLRWLLAGFGGLLATGAAFVAAGGLFALRREADQERGKGWLPRSSERPYAAGKTTRRSLRVGDWVEVRSAQEILATLDAKGSLDALPFMPEMLSYCGKRFVVSHRADKILDMIDKTGFRLRRMERAVFLDNVRCDGSAHDGCQQACRIIWKTAWLRRVEPDDTAPEPGPHIVPEVRAQLLPCTRRDDPVGSEDPVYRCQATELLAASGPMHAWDPRVDLRALTSGNVRLRDFVLVLLGRAFSFAQELRGGASFPGYIHSVRGKTPQERLDLQPGEWVEVKSITEISSTLDGAGRNRGMRFDHEMVRYCGGRYRVRNRVERIIDERTGRMLYLRNPCVILDGVEATGEFLRFNPQREYPYWREIWLRRLSPPAEKGPDAVHAAAPS